MDTEKEALVGWSRTEGGAMGVPWKEESKMVALAREAVRVEAMVAMMGQNYENILEMKKTVAFGGGFLRGVLGLE